MDVTLSDGYTVAVPSLHELRMRSVKAAPTPASVAYSYLRFSSPAQADGDSVRRQTALRESWLKRNPSVKLNTSLTLIDAGVSGYTGKHRTNQKHALATFLDLVERGRVSAGSYLIVENLDRLTRECPVDAIPAVLGLIKAGVRVVQLAPTEVIYDAEMDQGRLMMMLWELSRGHAESKRKSGLCGEAWQAKKQAAREHRTPLGNMCPAWLEVVDGKFRVKADAARAVRRVFELCAAGVGTFGILARLNEEKVPPIGRSGAWERSYVKKLLSGRAVLGEYQPGRGRLRTPEGEPVPGYYPAVVDEKLFHAAQDAMKNRARKSGRPAVGAANPFSGLLTSATDGCPLHVAGSRGHKYLVSAKALQKATGAKWAAFPLDVFRDVVLSKLEELKAVDLFADPGAEKLVTLTKQLADLERKRAAATDQFEADPESAHWQGLVTKYDRECRAAARELVEERQRAANPLSSSWVEAVELMATQEPERLRAALTTVIDGVWCLLIAIAGKKVAAVQVLFKGGSRREYIILHTPHRGSLATGKPAETLVKTFAEAGLSCGDLRKPDEAALLERLILKHAGTAESDDQIDRDAKERQKAAALIGNKTRHHKEPPVPANLPEPSRCDSRDQAGKALGVSGKTVDHATTAAEQEPVRRRRTKK
ncbi:site-specific recombinase : Recombinase OS=Nitrobacter hamburgensis (strain X14 / DSM 10229) GN=Nham_0143 PE=4 SV=1: Resolvase: Recombinase [Gemmataceae bacterium]|nr:site-specific recombinase : Recombinase OS=Nitrobacter hamburgensis (strain X14 / DSM 10229) GN=Nham_0143 PE=4 SV=1: Resolvase: Recombinase [Gemmataceae bacterium]VTT99080.1 site-specific recombinase : Recombinase OS=Nitrobacter hamburgensis (strain X14 / DSM 10229) GN=Nham_0143 PE=4 SV=1: Resolvase: Recombinase [Gemmataceae bacterium]